MTSRAVLRRLGAVAAALVLAGCSASPETGTGGFVTGDGSITVLPAEQRTPAPTITGETLDGTAWSSDTAAGKVLVYNVWGSWCAPCRAEAPDLEAAAEQTADRAVFIGLNTRDADRAAPSRFVANHGITYPSLFDPDGRLLLAFAGDLPPSAIPTTLLVDREGRIAARVVGATTQTTLVGLIDDIAEGR
ncbi:MAG: TlpA disulfide reductase family protein [Propionicimonas sp.]|uniref:TlpA family protein disulfide reductase n=1 Tax=Propionicimonas sp. TaxID=1955623 RepID=UPI002B2167DD|nr:TlpA disulfide reductase family protein [Propionicimonas sp.]MEA4944924.1 TlpA disulfide reductase family protein [Propionicimonas sp.]MEA5117923.1 TlpA disulfide reductase family protein [Propionicimonas sp.]